VLTSITTFVLNRRHKATLCGILSNSKHNFQERTGSKPQQLPEQETSRLDVKESEKKRRCGQSDGATGGRKSMGKQRRVIEEARKGGTPASA